jgi:hypothetical protein
VTLKCNFDTEHPALELKVVQGCGEHHLSVVGHMTFECLFALASRTMETGLCFLVFGNVETSLISVCLAAIWARNAACPGLNRYMLA